SHPVRSTVTAGGILVLLAVPAIRLETASLGAADIPRDLAIMKTYDRIQEAFPGGPLPAQVVVTAPDVDAPQVRGAMVAMKIGAVATGQMHEPITVDVNDRRTAARIQVPLAGDGVDKRSKAAPETLRQTVIPPTVGKVGEVHVT